MRGSLTSAGSGLSGHVEEAYTGHALVTVFGRDDEVDATFAWHNQAVHEAGTAAQFLSGLIQPVLTFLGNVNYVLIAVVGGLRVASGALSIGDVQAFIQYVLQFNQQVTGMASIAGQLPSAVASAERVFALLDADEEAPGPDRPARLERSAGERQLLTIARAHLKEPSILVLDEATSSVDSRTEMLIQQAMARLRRGRTSFIIAHRLSTIRDADVILVMEQGRVVEQGSHDDVLARGGAYARLYAAQFDNPTAA